MWPRPKSTTAAMAHAGCTEQAIECLDRSEVGRVPRSLVTPSHRSVVVDHPTREDQLVRSRDMENQSGTRSSGGTLPSLCLASSRIQFSVHTRRGRCSRATVRQKFVSRRNYFITVSVCSSKLTRKWFPVAPRRGKGKQTLQCRSGQWRGVDQCYARKTPRRLPYL